MADIKWIKITTDMFEDEKIDFISSLPEADAIIVIWIRLLALAGKCNAGGYVFLTEKIPYTDEMLAHKFKKQLNTIKLALETFRRLEMIEMDEHGIFLPKWEKYQEVEKLDRIREQTRLRVAEHRNKKRLELKESNVTVTDDVTTSNAIEQELDIEQDIDKEINKGSSLPPQFEKFWNVHPKKVGRQVALEKWKAALKKGVDPEEIIKAANNYAAECARKGTDKQYIMHPATFLSKERWEDYTTTGGDENGQGGLHEFGTGHKGQSASRSVPAGKGSRRVSEEQFDSLGIGH
ncbi:phage replisome organizer N-terminal domain-containing protein [Paenibacillus thermotolerans]|uniref:phage replisome organizer N-terminal domain-containing protein n=1 Tax=Paenibacillus thermotolerans TaxID=3027807 RepID=UPI002368AFFD|nr:MULTISPECIES: phage replisome organizer N-terminal domain-containing protein [unclassified Paenibacillus]